MRGNRSPLKILALLALLWFPVGCGDDSQEDPAVAWGNFLVGTWRLASISFLDQSIDCPGEVELEEGGSFGCGEMTIIFRLDGTFRGDGFWQNSYSRDEGIWLLLDNEPVLEVTERGQSEAGPVEDGDMQTIDPREILTLQRSGGSLWMTEIVEGPSVPITAVLE